MIDMQKYASGDNTEGAPSVTVRFDEGRHSSEWTTVQYVVDFLAAAGFSSATVSALQTVVDSNTPAE